MDEFAKLVDKAKEFLPTQPGGHGHGGYGLSDGYGQVFALLALAMAVQNMALAFEKSNKLCEQLDK